MKSRVLTIERKIQETEDAVTFYFKKPLFGKFKYLSGQFLTVSVNIDGQNHMRAYSLSSSPDLDTSSYCITIKRVQGGLVSNYMIDHVHKGSQIEVKEPMGSFKTFAKNSSARHVVLIGGGSGITPLFSIAKTLLYKEPQSTVSLYYFNRNQDTIIFDNYIQFLQKEYPNKFFVKHILSEPLEGWQDEPQMISENLMGQIVIEAMGRAMAKCEYYICGPGPLMEIAEQGLLAHNVVDEQIFKESFVAEKSSAVEEQNLNFPTRSIKMVLERETHGLLVPLNTSVLDAALSNKLKLPYACGSGICGSCMCKVKEGDVQMVGNHSLSDKQIKKGYVLACMSYVNSDNVLLEVV